MGRLLRIFTLPLLAVLWLSAQNEPKIDGPFPARDGETCVVCNTRVNKNDLAYVIDGQRVAVMRAMETDLLSNPLEYVTKFRPEGMIFSGQQSKRESNTYFWAGVLVLAGLMFGGGCAHMAVVKGLSPWSWFVMGFLFSAPATLVLALKDPAQGARKAPEGLAKVPTTHPPLNCSACGAANHPAASRCPACGATLTPTVTSEVASAKIQ